MKNILKKITVMSITLVLFCMGAIAQSQKDTRGVPFSNDYMTVSNIDVTLQEGQSETIFVTPAPGYNVIIKYQDCEFYLHESFEGEIFSINPNRTGNNTSSFIIEAKQANSKKPTETIELDVEMKLEDRLSSNGNMPRTSRVTITITVNPALGSRS